MITNLIADAAAAAAAAFGDYPAAAAAAAAIFSFFPNMSMVNPTGAQRLVFRRRWLFSGEARPYPRHPTAGGEEHFVETILVKRFS